MPSWNFHPTSRHTAALATLLQAFEHLPETDMLDVKEYNQATDGPLSREFLGFGHLYAGIQRPSSTFGSINPTRPRSRPPSHVKSCWCTDKLGYGIVTDVLEKSDALLEVEIRATTE